MSTVKQYYIDPYQKETEAVITAVTPKGIILDRTIAYPEGGGQPGDKGFINQVPFSDTQKEGEDILHIMDSSAFSIGDKVTLTLDWKHRYDYMKQHTAQHMLSGVLFSAFGIGTLSVHQGEDILTIETDRMDIDDKTLLEAEDMVNKAICENHRVSYLEVSHKEAEELGLRRSIKVEGDVRLVKIEGVDIIACGGLHTASTGEAGCVNYVSSESIRGHVRTIWRVGDRARNARRLAEREVREASALLSAHEGELASAVSKMVESDKLLKAERRELERSVASYLVSLGDSIITSPIPLTEYKEAVGEKPFFATYDKGDAVSWFFHIDDEIFNSLKPAFKELGIKGGGRGGCFQGVCEKRVLDKLLALVKETMK